MQVRGKIQSKAEIGLLDWDEKGKGEGRWVGSRIGTVYVGI